MCRPARNLAFQSEFLGLLEAFVSGTHVVEIYQGRLFIQQTLLKGFDGYGLNCNTSIYRYCSRGTGSLA